MQNRIGQQFGNYRLIRLLGRGGFAEVYLGEHVYMRSQAAVKVLYGPLTPSGAQNFLEEARTLASLEHPHIVGIKEFDIKEDIPFLVINYAPNGTLRQRHAKGQPVPLETIVSYVLQIASALQ
jgi:serine/threonine protein kinase